MSQFKFDNNNEENSAQVEPSSMHALNEATRDVLSIIVRLCGIVLLFIGLWIAIQVFNEALALYKDPSNIERVALAIEKGSNIDKSLVPIKETLLSDDSSLDLETGPQTTAPANGGNGIRISYFIAWVVDLLLLLLLARISLMAIKTGGELALYDAQVKKLAKQLTRANNSHERTGKSEGWPHRSVAVTRLSCRFGNDHCHSVLGRYRTQRSACVPAATATTGKDIYPCPDWRTDCPV